MGARVPGGHRFDLGNDSPAPLDDQALGPDRHFPDAAHGLELVTAWSQPNSCLGPGVQDRDPPTVAGNDHLDVGLGGGDDELAVGSPDMIDERADGPPHR